MNKIPAIIQMETLECVAASLAMSWYTIKSGFRYLCCATSTVFLVMGAMYSASSRNKQEGNKP